MLRWLRLLGILLFVAFVFMANDLLGLELGDTESTYRRLVDDILSCPEAAVIKPRHEWLVQMGGAYGEQVVAVAYLNPQAVVELLVNHEASSYTILRSNPAKLGCVAVSGFFPFAPSLPPSV